MWFNKETSPAITDFGNGVFLFDCYGEKFCKTLSQFITDHPGFRVVAITAENAFESNRTHIVITERKRNPEENHGN